MFEQKRHAGARGGGRAVLPLALLALLVTATGPSQGATFPTKAAIAALSSAVGQAGNPCREQIDGWRILVDPEEHGMTTSQMADVLRRAGIRDFYALKGGAEAGQMGLGFFRGKRNADRRIAALKDLGFDARSEPFTATVPRADCNDTGAAATSSPPAAPSSAGDAIAAGTDRAPKAAPATPEPGSEAAEASPPTPSPSGEPASRRAGVQGAAGRARDAAASGGGRPPAPRPFRRHCRSPPGRPPRHRTRSRPGSRCPHS